MNIYKLQSIQFLRGMAVLFVVFFHLYIMENKYNIFEKLLPDMFQFGAFGVDLFFVISGFVMVMVTRGKFQNLKQSIKFLYNRLTRIYPLYWFYTLLALTVFLIQPSWVNSSQGNQVNILESFLLLPSDKLPLVQVGWSLIHEVYFYLVYFLIFLLIPESFLLLVLVIWGLIFVTLNLILNPGNPYFDLIFHPLTIEFIGGCLLAILYYQTEKSKLGIKTLLALSGISLVFAVIGYEMYQTATGIIAPLGWWRVLLYGLPAWIIVYGLINAERSGFIFNKMLSQIGDASYSIYLSHLFTINVVGRIWAIFSVDDWWDNILFILITLALVLIVGFLSYWVIENRLLAISRKAFTAKRRQGFFL